MNKLEELENEAFKSRINVQRAELPESISGLYYDDGTNQPLIALNECLKTKSEQTCVLAEELGHYYTSCGNLLTDPSVSKAIIQKQETKAKRWAFSRLVSLKNIIKAYEAGCNNLYEMAEYLSVTQDFLEKAFASYNSMYGKYKKRGNYIIYFDPPGIFKNIK